MQVCAVGTGLADEAVDGDFLECWDIAERDGTIKEAEGSGATGRAQGAVFVVRGGVIPGAEALRGGAGEGAGGVVGVVEG